MDCRAACELIMKYIDKEIDCKDEQLLKKHLNSCHGCSFEFQSLKETVDMLDEVEMENAPEGIEEKVISRIIREDKMKAANREWIMGIAACFMLILGWIGATYIIMYTPALNVAAGSFKIFSYYANELETILIGMWSMAIMVSAKLISLARIVEVVAEDFMNMYSVTVLEGGLLTFIGLYMLNYVQRTVGR